MDEPEPLDDESDSEKDQFQEQFEKLLSKVGNKYISTKSKFDSDRP